MEPYPHTAPLRRYTPLALGAVSITESFWAERQRINRERTIPHVQRQLALSGRLDAFRRDWNPSADVRARGPWGGTTVMFWDSDVAKWIEAACYSLATHPDPALDAQLDELIALIAARQQPDGYLNTWFITVDPEARWANLRDWHELYCAGHLIEAAVAHFAATGKRTLLDVMCRYADYIATIFGDTEGQRRGYCGHPEIELALVRLWRTTGEERYLNLSRYFVDERGRRPHYFDHEARERGEDPRRFWARSYEYNQSHRPVREQQQVVGHAVRAMYLYCAMADLALIDGDAALLTTCRRLWQHLTTTRTYVMGGIGTSRQNEGFTSDYDLPNESAYAETCAAIGMIFWAQRMLQAGLDGSYGDMLELALYNAVLSGVALDGEGYFYDNPLASDGTHHRQQWFACPCCPPNLARILAGLGEYAYSQATDEAVVHLFVGGSASFDFGDQRVTLHQATRYPWDGQVTLMVATDAAKRFTLHVRIPGWCRDARIELNGVPIDCDQHQANGYLTIEREWQHGDTLTLDLPLAVERIYAHPAVRADVGKVAIRRGPIIYCFEQIDHEVPLAALSLARDTALTARYDAELLGGVVVIEGMAAARDQHDWAGMLYRTMPPVLQPCRIRGIPYFAWDNRTPGAMSVWLPE
ncbi:MAG TPA: glycoside hydrolase family 127 protein [Roseiflexaceae bacterium]|nr:glycoside hydrolase family 127 protein [Roseiflexaceae bacterium]HMP39482.1 glycoside hydrolase family 127 protein [Roseiflexaceae bacterium]